VINRIKHTFAANSIWVTFRVHKGVRFVGFATSVLGLWSTKRLVWLYMGEAVQKANYVTWCDILFGNLTTEHITIGIGFFNSKIQNQIWDKENCVKYQQNNWTLTKPSCNVHEFGLCSQTQWANRRFKSGQDWSKQVTCIYLKLNAQGTWWPLFNWQSIGAAECPLSWSIFNSNPGTLILIIIYIMYIIYIYIFFFYSF
jgi:hypothetical protein